MTRAFEQLSESPQTDFNINDLSYAERGLARKIKVQQTSTVENDHSEGSFTTVFYLEGDEREAADVFVDEHSDRLAELDFSKRNVIQTSVSQHIYDWILHAMGERELTKHETVVLEKRSDGTRWIIDREQYETSPNRRYSISEQYAVRMDGLSVSTVFHAHEDAIAESDLEDCDAIAGEVRYLLEYFRVEESLECRPVSLEGEMAVQKPE
ncbi:hypothetical protein [Halostagnicola bangensis]